MVRAHRFAWSIANGKPVPDGLFVLHRCDVPLCVNPDHLFLGTQLDNMRDCARKGRMQFGEERASAKLTVSQIRRIRRLAGSGRPMQDLAREYGVTGPTIQSIVHRRKWRWVP
jgi:HNH endonuclease